MGGFGPDTVVFISRAPGAGYQQGSGAVLAETRTPVSGCLHRPVTPPTGSASPATAEEDPEVGVSVSTEWWQSTCPPVSAAMACKASDAIEVDGIRYLVLSGAKRHGDFSKPFKVTIVSQRQDIG